MKNGSPKRRWVGVDFFEEVGWSCYDGATSGGEGVSGSANHVGNP